MHFFKGNPNFQGILNWILQILHYHCGKQHKHIENLHFIEQNIIISFCPSLCLLWLVVPSPFSVVTIFQFLDTVGSFHGRPSNGCQVKNFKFVEISTIDTTNWEEINLKIWRPNLFSLESYCIFSFFMGFWEQNWNFVKV